MTPSTCAKHLSVSNRYLVLLCANDFVEIRSRLDPASEIFRKYITGSNNNLTRPAKIYEDYFQTGEDVIIAREERGDLYVLQVAAHPLMPSLFLFNYIYFKWYDAFDAALLPGRS